LRRSFFTYTAPIDLKNQAGIDIHVALLCATRNCFFIRLRSFIGPALGVIVHFTTLANNSYQNIVMTHENVAQAIASRGDNG
jgi:DNA-binding FadR family transcriptional regulator